VVSFAGHCCLLCLGLLPNLEYFCFCLLFNLWSTNCTVWGLSAWLGQFMFLGLLLLKALIFSYSTARLPCRVVPRTIGYCLQMTLLWQAIVSAVSNVNSASNWIFSERDASSSPTTIWSRIISSLLYAQWSAEQNRSVIKLCTVSLCNCLCKLNFALSNITFLRLTKWPSNFSFTAEYFFWLAQKKKGCRQLYLP